MSLYCYIRERRPGLGFSDYLRTIRCKDCKTELQTLSRNCIRCKTCAEATKRARLAKKDARKRAEQIARPEAAARQG